MARKTRKRRGRKVKRTRVRERLRKTRGRISRKRARRGGVLTKQALAAAALVVKRLNQEKQNEADNNSELSRLADMSTSLAKKDDVKEAADNEREEIYRNSGFGI